MVLRTRIIVAGGEGRITADLARRVVTVPQTVGRWRKRFLVGDLQGQYPEICPRRRRTFEDNEVPQVIKGAQQKMPAHARPKRPRRLDVLGSLSASPRYRSCRPLSVQPHVTQTFRVSTAPPLIGKGLDITGLYPNPPDRALVLCVDEKSQIPPFGRTQPKLLMDLDYCKDRTYDYFRHSTTLLFAALDIVHPKVIPRCKVRCRSQEFLMLLCLLDEETLSDLKFRLVLDERTTYSYATVKEWLAKRPRYRMHVAPTCSFWSNQKERWINLLSGQVFQRNMCHSGRGLVDQIKTLTDSHYTSELPFVWAIKTRPTRSYTARWTQGYPFKDSPVHAAKYIPSTRASLKVCESASLYEHFGVHSAVLRLRPHCASDRRSRLES